MHPVWVMCLAQGHHPLSIVHCCSAQMTVSSTDSWIFQCNVLETLYVFDLEMDRSTLVVLQLAEIKLLTFEIVYILTSHHAYNGLIFQDQSTEMLSCRPRPTWIANCVVGSIWTPGQGEKAQNGSQWHSFMDLLPLSLFQMRPCALHVDLIEKP